MACIQFISSNEITFLHPRHVFGRKNSSANSSLVCDLISRRHASIEWCTRKWVIQDFSRNGTWVNNKQIKPNTSITLNTGDIISLGSDGNNGISFRVINTDKPHSLIYRAHPSLQAIHIEDSNLIPDPMSPDYGLYYCYSRKGWFSQNFNADIHSTDQHEEGPHNHGEEIYYAGNRWTLFLLDQRSTLGSITKQPAISIEDTEFQVRFNKSDNDVRINLISKENEFELDPQPYTKMLAHLINLQQQSPEGWVSFQHLSKAISKDQANINFQLFMFRHQLVTTLLNNCNDASPVIERNADSLRFAAPNYSIYRDGKLDQSSDYD